MTEVVKVVAKNVGVFTASMFIGDCVSYGYKKIQHKVGKHHHHSHKAKTANDIARAGVSGAATGAASYVLGRIVM